MSLILGKYKNKKKLGKGAYGEVLLVEDPLGNSYALKLISLKSLQRQPYLLEYLQGQIQCMQEMHSPYIMKLIESDSDDKYKYMLCQYCDGGDLLNLQAKQPGQVFTLERATQILSHVIIGLELLHKEQYLHRDIKSQNILIKNQNGKELFKLADFGFSKKSYEIGGTVLGTENYMSPQIYRSDNYGFEVDMWAFGVLFFFMLNKEFPFKINPHFEIERKQAQLLKMAKNFSYKKAVQNTKKKLVINCTAQTEDLFKKIFDVDAQSRLNFAQIRQHPLFKKYFPIIQQASKILYSKRFQSKIIGKKKLQSSILKKATNLKQTKQQIQKVEEDQEEVEISHSYIKNKNQPKEKEIIQNKAQQLQFLFDSGQEFLNSDFLSISEKMNLGYNITKNFLNQLKPAQLSKQYPNQKWVTYCKTKDFNKQEKGIMQDLQKAQMKFQLIYESCENLLSDIKKINPKFQNSFDRDIKEVQFDGAFKESYRKATHYTFNTLRQSLKNNKKSGTRLNYALVILVICHVFNHIFKNSQDVKTIFQDYLAQKKREPDTIDFSQLREWMTKASGSKLNNMAKTIIKKYFAS